MKKYFIKTFGCQMNISDSERIAGFLENNDYEPASDVNRADLAIFNTCGVRQMAEDRVYGQIHNLRKAHPKIKIVLTGCLANRKDVQRRLKNKADAFAEIKDIEISLNNLGVGKKEYDRDYLKLVPKYQNDFQAYIPIMTGCNNFCAYCIVPYARGREVSRPATEIISEIKRLVKSGYKSITLLGQNVNSYDDGKIKFPTLLKKINSIPGKFWINFVSSHPKDMSDELIETIAKSKKVCENIHLPIQSGSDEIIQKMNRKYTTKHYMSLVRKIKSAFKKYKPGIQYSLTSDIIVGFPGETKKQFLQSAEVMEKSKYDMIFFGQYSPRPGTVAWKMKDNVSKPEKERRERFLNEILKKTVFTNNKKYKNTTQEVLIEKEKNDSYFGKTRTGKNVKITSAKKDLVGQFAKVKITQINIWNLEGEIK